MSDRAQLDAGHTRLIVSLAIAFVVLALVVEEALSAPALATGEVEQVCGLCHVDWRRQLTGLAIIGGLVIVAHWLLGGPKWPPEEEDDE